MFTMAIILAILLLGYFYNVSTNVKKENNNKRLSIIEILSKSEDFLINTDIDLTKIDGKYELNKKRSIYEKFYNTFEKSLVKPNIYIFTSDNINLLNKYITIPKGVKIYSKNWGVFRELNNSDNVITTVAVDTAHSKKLRYLKLGRTIKKDSTVVGYVFLTFEEKEVVKLFEKYTTETTITDETGSFFYNQIGIPSRIYNKISDAFGHKDGIVTLEKNKCYINFLELDKYGLVLYSGDDFSNMRELLLGAFIVFLVILFVLCLSLYYGTNSISKIGTQHLDELRKAFLVAEDGNLDDYSFKSSYNEFLLIEDSYNTMLRSLRKQIERNKEISYILVNTTISDLKAQFEPHFLFNTLETIRVMCKIDPKVAEKMILKLSRLLRYSLNYRFEDVRLDRDIVNIENYLSILKFRFNKKFKYEIKIDQEVKSCLIPRLIVQPLIENSAKYGMGENNILNIEISAYRYENSLIIDCTDNGVGIEENKLNEIREMMKNGQNTSEHFGIYNIHRMLILKYGEEYGLEISSEKNVKTLVRATLPYISGEE